MYIIKPIGPNREKLVIHQTRKYLQLGENIFHHPFKPINISFNLNGLASGMFCVKNGVPLIRYNPYIFAKYFDYSLSNTVPHEVSHYLIYSLFGLKGARPHGKEWKDLMLKFGATPSRTNVLDLDGIPTKRQKRHLYRCDCRDHLISSRRHNRIKDNQARYFCRLCKGELQPSA